MIPLLTLVALLGSAAPPGSGGEVTLAIAGPVDERVQLEASVAELLRRLSVVVVPLAADGAALARVRVELLPDATLVEVRDRRGAQAVQRRLPRSPSSQVTVEAAALVVLSAVEALAERERTPAPRRPLLPVADPSPALVRAPAPGPRSPVGVELGALVTGRFFGPAAPVVFGGGVLASLRLEQAGAWGPRLSLLVSYSGPFPSTSEAVQLSTQSLTARLLAGVRYRFGRLAIDGQLGGGFDSLFTETRSTTLPAAFLRDRHDASPMVGALLAARVAVTGTTEVFLAATVEVDLLPRRFVSDLPAGRTVLFESPRVRPALLLGFSFDVLGNRGVL